jgi:hypothetical protein
MSSEVFATNPVQEACTAASESKRVTWTICLGLIGRKGCILCALVLFLPCTQPMSPQTVGQATARKNKRTTGIVYHSNALEQCLASVNHDRAAKTGSAQQLDMAFPRTVLPMRL